MEHTPGDRWRSELAGWAVPPEILEQAEQSPWQLPPACFTRGANPPTRTTTERCLEVLDGGSVLDVGVGGGRASLHLGAASITGVDVREPQLELATQEAQRMGVPFKAVLGEWPVIADEVPAVDVVVCSHVVYNVEQIEAFLEALTSHARRRVVVELDAHHPLTRTRAAWQAFWGLERPEGPSWEDLVAVLESLGIQTLLEEALVPSHKGEVTAGEVARLRSRLCLPQERDAEVAAFLRSTPRLPRHVVTLWWDPTA